MVSTSPHGELKSYDDRRHVCAVAPRTMTTGVPAHMPPKPCRALAARPGLVHGPIPGHQGVRFPGVTGGGRIHLLRSSDETQKIRDVRTQPVGPGRLRWRRRWRGPGPCQRRKLETRRRRGRETRCCGQVPQARPLGAAASGPLHGRRSVLPRRLRLGLPARPVGQLGRDGGQAHHVLDPAARHAFGGPRLPRRLPRDRRRALLQGCRAYRARWSRPSIRRAAGTTSTTSPARRRSSTGTRR